jgi:outer membrane immunogenic protein
MIRFFGVATALFFTFSAQVAQAQKAPRSFNGFYAGVQVGGSNSRLGSGASPFGFSEPNLFFFGFRDVVYQASRNSHGHFTGGGFVGYNFALNNGLVFGAEADLSLMRMKRTVIAGSVFSGLGGALDPNCVVTLVFPPNPLACPPLPPDTAVTAQAAKLELNGMSTLRARVGYSFGNTLAYVTAGPAFSLMKITSQESFASSILPLTSTQTSRQKIVIGASVGLGLEHYLTDNLRLRAEYLYYDFGSQRVTYGNGAQHKFNVNGHSARLGLVVGF